MARSDVLIALVVLVAGCATVSSRSGPDKPNQLYPATKLTVAATKDGWCWMFMACPIYLVSLPVDVALDTLFLPVDAMRLIDHEEAEKKTEATEAPNVTEAS